MSERADTIRQRMEADVRRSLHSIGQVSDFMEFGTYEVLVDEVVEDAMHHIEHLLAEIEELKAQARAQ
jgi:cephalosporin hydroxylase